jgi:hypothetical protein
MRRTDIEVWCLSVVDRVLARQPIEDARVEVKADWPPPEKAARRIAGHANAARGEPVLWVVGLDERGAAIREASGDDIAAWSAQVFSRFDGIAPALTHLVVPTRSAYVVALYFETDRAPFVVRNDVYGQTGAGPVEREVPWRDGTAVRSARREDLLRLLVPLRTLPTLERMWARLSAAPVYDPRGGERLGFQWTATFAFYIVPASEAAIVVPYHRSAMILHLGAATPRVVLDQFSCVPYAPHANGAHASPHLRASHTELLVGGPGAAIGYAYAAELPGVDDPDRLATPELQLIVASAHAGRNVELRAPLHRSAAVDRDGVRRWSWEG